MSQNQQTEEVRKDFAEHGCTVPVIDFTVEKDDLPKEITKSIAHLLHMASHYMIDGEEHPLMFVAIDREGGEHLIDPSGIPVKALVMGMVKRITDQVDAAALLTISEGWQLPQEVAKEWAKGNRPEGMQIKDHPDVIDVLYINVETEAGNWVASSPVSHVTDPATPRTLTEPIVFKEQAVVEGQMVNVLKKNRPQDEEEHPMMELLLSMMGIKQVSPEELKAATEAAEAETEVAPDSATKH